MSVSICLPEFSPDNMFLTSGPFVTKHSTVLHHYASGSRAKKICLLFSNQGQTEDMAVCTLLYQADPLATRLTLMVYHYKPKSSDKELDYCGHSQSSVFS